MSSTTFDWLVVLDFEATCIEGGAPTPQEVIELPSVLVSLAERRVVDEFGTFVRPVHHPTLSAFCTELTSIQQADVDPAPTFVEAIEAHQGWLRGHGLLGEGATPFAFVTCGDWDFQTLLPVQCGASGPPITSLPAAYREWINIKAVFEKTLGQKKAGGMTRMLERLDLELLGRHHRGIDDCHNIARIALNLAARGASFEITSRLSRSRYPDLPLTLRCGDEERQVVLGKRALPTLMGLIGMTFRRQAEEVRTVDGELLTDQRLLALPDGATLLIRLRSLRRR